MSLQPTHPFRGARHALALLILSATTAFAGTPLICHPYAIGEARTLPGSDGDWKGVNPDYDRRNLERDTLALLQPETPVIVRMETLRRAAIYATAGLRGWDKGTYTADDRAMAQSLLKKLQERAQHATGPAQALALFDVGFYSETLRHAQLDLSVDGYAVLVKAAKLRGADAEFEFALALASAWPKRKEHFEHLSRARAGSQPGTLLASNLTSHFGRS